MSNPIRHWELVVNDVAKAKRFYAGVFHWRFDDHDPAYTLIDTGEGVGGGMRARPADGAPATLNLYFDVDDVQRTLRAVVEAGGTVTLPRTEIPGVGWFGMFLDPDRIPICILERAPAREEVPGWTELRRLGGELELKLHLAGMEMRDRWRALQPRLEKELSELGSSLRAMLTELDGTRKDQ